MSVDPFRARGLQKLPDPNARGDDLTPALGLGLPLSRLLHRDWNQPCRTCPSTGLAPCNSCTVHLVATSRGRNDRKRVRRHRSSRRSPRPSRRMPRPAAARRRRAGSDRASSAPSPTSRASTPRRRISAPVLQTAYAPRVAAAASSGRAPWRRRALVANRLHGRAPTEQRTVCTTHGTANEPAQVRP